MSDRIWCDTSWLEGHPQEIAAIALALKPWNKMKPTIRAMICPFIEIVDCETNGRRRQGKGVCHRLFPQINPNACARNKGGLDQALIIHGREIEDVLWSLADTQYNYNFRNDRLAAAAQHGFRHILECSIELYAVYKSSNVVADRLGVSQNAVLSELRHFGIKSRPRGGARTKNQRYKYTRKARL